MANKNKIISCFLIILFFIPLYLAMKSYTTPLNSTTHAIKSIMDNFTIAVGDISESH